MSADGGYGQQTEFSKESVDTAWALIYGVVIVSSCSPEGENTNTLPRVAWKETQRLLGMTALTSRKLVNMKIA